MSSNSMTDYVEAFRANLPAGITFDATLNRYFCNDKRYLNEWEVEAYLNYVKKFGFTTISAYAILNLEPPLVLDFDETFYRTGGTATDLASAATHTRAGNATMVDSDGLLKWAPHNFAPYSEDFSNAHWTANDGGGDITSSTAVSAPSGNGPVGLFTEDTSTGLHFARSGSSIAFGFVGGNTYTQSVYVKANGRNRVTLYFSTDQFTASRSATFDLTTETAETPAGGSSSIEFISDGWYKISYTHTCVASGDNYYGLIATNDGTSDSYAGDGTSGIFVWGAHLYRSDLGGMANNPDQPVGFETYVPTTSAAVYLPRVGHHIWDVEKGATVNPLGDELVTNGTFDTDTTGWTAFNATTAFDAGRISITSTGSGQGSLQDITTVAGKVYTVTADLVSTDVNTGLRVADTGVSPVIVAVQGLGSPQTVTLTFVAVGTDTGIYLRNEGAGTSLWDNVSVKEINPWVKGYLHESEARTNDITHPTDFTDASWTKSAVTVASEATASPISATTSSKITPTGSGAHFFYDTITLTANTYTQSIYAKAFGYNFLFVESFGDGTLKSSCFNLSTGAIVSQSNATASIEDVGNGWYRCSSTFVATAASHTVQFNPSDNGVDNDYTADGTSAILAVAPQMEVGSTPSSYIPTSGSTVTRAADVMTIPIENIPYPEPVVIGPELVTNGTFDTDLTGWTDDSTGAGSTSQSGGQAVLTGAGTSDQGILFQTFTTVTGNVYRLTLDRPTSSVIVQLGAAGSGSSNIHQSSNSSGPIDHVFVALSTSTTVTVRNFNVVGDSAVDNISVREINPLAVSIAVEGYMTYADSDNSNEVVFHQWQLDASNRISARVATNSTKIGDPFFEQAALGVSDFVTGADDTYSPGINVPFSIASRNGSTFINGAVDGTALTANTTPVAFPDLSATDMSLFTTGNFHITKFRMWGDTNGDIGDTGIAEASA